jgi:hypothetical protein
VGGAGVINNPYFPNDDALTLVFISNAMQFIIFTEVYVGKEGRNMHSSLGLDDVFINQGVRRNHRSAGVIA